MKQRTTTILLAAAILLLPAFAWAVELKDYAVGDDSKKITVTFTLSAAVKDSDVDVVSNYQGNFVALKVNGLKFTKQQLKADVPPGDKALKDFYRFLRFTPGEGAGELRIYLAKPVTPADVLSELREAKFTVEILKPWWKLQGGAPPTDAAPDPAEFIPDTPPQDGPAAPPVLPETGPRELPPPGDGFRDVTPEEPPAETPGWGDDTPADTAAQPQPEEPADSAPVTPEVPAEEAAPGDTRPNAGEIYNDTEMGELFGHNGAAPSETQPAAAPRTPPPGNKAKPNNGPGYTEFDLDQIPITGIEIRGLPFDEALLKLVASSGFNVIVGKEVESTEVNLNFTQKQISLKIALDLLCIAYDLTYTIEPDAIVIKGKN